jgi:DNA-binding transcriptional MerR regulator
VPSSAMPIGDFSRATRLTAKALRFYHRVGLLEPAAVDPGTRYRRYAPEQIDVARVIHHLRSVDMPIEEVRRVLAATDEGERRAAIAEHLERMQRLLAETQDSVAAIQAMLAGVPVPVELRRIPATRVLVIRAEIDLAELGDWFGATRAALRDAVAPEDVAGPLGGLWSTDLFLEERGAGALFLPLTASAAPPADGRGRVETLPATLLAVAVHEGSDATVGQAYAALGAHVAREGIGAAGPLREAYAGGAPAGDGITEIGWPVRDEPTDGPARAPSGR